MKQFNLKLQKRDKLGKATKALRLDGNVPGVVYGKAVDSVPVAANELEIEKIFREAGFNHVIELEVEGDTSHQVLFKDVDFHPVSGHVNHFDLLAVKKGEKIKAEVPVTLVGEAPGLISGRLIDQLIDSVEVETTPDRIPDHFELDISVLNEVGDSIDLSAIKIAEGVEVLTELEQPAVRLEEEREQVVEDTQPEPEEGAEGEDADSEATVGAETSETKADEEA